MEHPVPRQFRDVPMACRELRRLRSEASTLGGPGHHEIYASVGADVAWEAPGPGMRVLPQERLLFDFQPDRETCLRGAGALRQAGSGHVLLPINPRPPPGPGI